ncbi:hypothetical protein J5259_005313 [Klebsiella oxytoca]|nr:hypothetical protein [Klebsiella oxytoca]HAT1583179.1 hypothetical protein [Raoultella ornithinolytica]HAT1671071.1 hypothetical protein [Raoultella ornithinolytica]
MGSFRWFSGMDLIIKEWRAKNGKPGFKKG